MTCLVQPIEFIAPVRRRARPYSLQPRLWGVHEVHYALVIILAMGIGLFSPPFGVGLYARARSVECPRTMRLAGCGRT